MKHILPHFFAFIFLTFFTFSCTQTQDTAEDNLIVKILQESASSVVDTVLNNPEKFELQILYTQLDRDANNNPQFTSHEFGVNEEDYFYPASTVKMPAAFLALEKINQLNVPGLSPSTSMLTDSAYEGQTAVLYDSTSENNLPSVGHYIKKIFLVSDNDAFNRLYEFIGQEDFNEKLIAKGYENVRITHRLAIFNTPEQNRNTNPLRFVEGDEVLYEKDLVYSPHDYRYQGYIPKGVGVIVGDSLENHPKDFAGNNFIALAELQDMLKAVMFPEAVPQEARFNLTDEDYQLLYQYMSQLPGETTFPAYDTPEYYDSYSKFFMYGDSKESMPKHIRIFNKIGMAYGYLTDNAYIVDFENNVEFLLTAVIHVNENQIYNDGEYEYNEIGLPFLAQLGRKIYEYERQRERSHTPDLSRFKVTYDK